MSIQFDKNSVILIIDDELDTLMFLKLIFEKEGYEVHTEKNGLNAISTINEVKPDIILIDILMPYISGLEIIKSLKDTKEIHMLPIIALTSYHDTDMKLDVLKAGALDYITKPFQKDELLYKIKNFLKYSSKKASPPKIDKIEFSRLLNIENQILSPAVEKHCQFGYTYPKAKKMFMIEDDAELLRQLDFFAKEGKLEQIFQDIVYVCPECKHYNITFREICPHCESTIEDIKGLKCKKCNGNLYDTVIQYKCMNCGKLLLKADLEKKRIYEYKIVNIKPNGASSSQLTKPNETIFLKALKKAKLSYIEKNEFKNQVKHEILKAQKNNYTITVMSIHIKRFQEFFHKNENDFILKIMKSMLLELKKFLRKYDLISHNYNNENNYILLLPRTHINMAKIIAQRVKGYFEKITRDMNLEIKLASFPEDGKNENEVLAMLEIGIETFEEEFILSKSNPIK